MSLSLGSEGTQGWRSVVDTNVQVRKDVQQWMKARTALKKREDHVQGLDSHEEDVGTETPSLQWWEYASLFAEHTTELAYRRFLLFNTAR